MSRNAVIAGALVVIALAIVGLYASAPGGPRAEGEDGAPSGDPDLVGGYGELGSGGGSGSRSSHDPSVDAGVHGSDAGEGAPIPLPLAIEEGSEPPVREVSIPEAVPATITFPEPRTIDDEYDSANMIWSMIEARRADVRAQLEEARRVGDQQLSARLAHQLELLEIGDRNLSGIVRDLDARRAATAPSEEEGAHPEATEGAPPSE